jgi:hypothetical protein
MVKVQWRDAFYGVFAVDLLSATATAEALIAS